MRTAVLVIATVVAACCAGGAVLGAIGLARRPAGSTSGGSGAEAAVGSRPLGLNQPVRDGKFEFVVHSVSCGPSAPPSSMPAGTAVCLMENTSGR